jgi:lipopolysaccharide/colanic/teichoic acid biosynthesis glycosyltransferase
MNTTRESQFFLVVRPLLHRCGIVFAYRIVAHIREYTDLIPFVQLRIPVMDIVETMWFAALSGIVFVVVWFFFEQYALFRPKQQWYGSFLQTWLLRVVSTGFIAWLWFGYVFTSWISRFVVIIAALCSLFIITIMDLIRWLIARWQWASLVYRLLIVSDNEKQWAAISAEFVDHEHYTVVSLSTSQALHYTAPWDGSIIVGSVPEQRLSTWYQNARIHGKEVYQLAEWHFLEDTFGIPMTIWPLVVTAWRTSPLTERRRVWKRGGDIVLSGVWLLLLSPLFLIVALLITLDSPGPIFYTQQRVGKQKKLFRFVKFRTMFTHLSTGPWFGGDEAQKLYEQLIASKQNIRTGILPKIADDPRVTRVWKWLRKTSIDELPSLWSVFVGDMSLVWPRPHLPREVEQYEARHQKLFQVKPWITGYAQLHGRDKVPFDEEAKLDLRYIHHRSLRLDRYVLFATIQVIFKGK